MDEFPVDSTALTGARKRLILANKIDKLRHSTSKAKADRNWLQKSAKDLDIELDDVRLPSAQPFDLCSHGSHVRLRDECAERRSGAARQSASGGARRLTPPCLRSARTRRTRRSAAGARGTTARRRR